MDDTTTTGLEANITPPIFLDEKQESFNKIMNDYYKFLEGEENKVKKNNKRILRAIKNTNGQYYLRCLRKFLYDDDLNIGKMEFVSKPRGNYQSEDGYRKIKGVWVEQWTDGACDSYVGYIYILVRGNWIVDNKINHLIDVKKPKFLKVNYSC